MIKCLSASHVSCSKCLENHLIVYADQSCSYVFTGKVILFKPKKNSSNYFHFGPLSNTTAFLFFIEITFEITYLELGYTLTIITDTITM